MVGVSLDEIPCIDPTEVYAACRRAGKPTDWYGLPNRYVDPIGMEPGFGHLLMTKANYSLLKPGKAMTLRMQSDQGRKEFAGILLCGTPKQVWEGNGNPALLVPITDTRADAVAAGNFRYTWRTSPSQETPENEMTWAEAIAHLWTAAQTMGPVPTIPAPAAALAVVLKQFDGHGFKVASLIEDLLQAIGCVVTYDSALNTYGVSYLAGATEGIFQFARDYLRLLVSDDGPVGGPAVMLVPATLRVLSPVWSEDPETSELAMYAKDITLPAVTGKVRQVGAAVIQDFQPLRIDSAGTMLNQAGADERAEAMATIYAARLQPNSPVLPVAREYRGFLNDPRCRPGPLFDMVAWYDVGKGARTFVLRAGLDGTGELYSVSSLPAEGLIDDYHSPTVLTENGAVLRVGGTPPTPGKTFQNEGWWQDAPTLVRLIGSGLGAYMNRTASLRYGDWAVTATGGKGDLRAKLYRPWEVSGTGEDLDKFVTVTGVPETLAWLYGATLTDMNNFDPYLWTKTEDGAVYLHGANKETLDLNRAYLARRSTDEDGGPLLYTGSLGELPVYATFCCSGGSPGGSSDPLEEGWYCVSTDGCSTTTVEFYSGPAYPQPPKEICSGPYATEAEANAACTPEYVYGGCGTCTTVPKYLQIVISQTAYPPQGCLADGELFVFTSGEFTPGANTWTVNFNCPGFGSCPTDPAFPSLRGLIKCLGGCVYGTSIFDSDPFDPIGCGCFGFNGDWTCAAPGLGAVIGCDSPGVTPSYQSSTFNGNCDPFFLQINVGGLLLTITAGIP